MKKLLSINLSLLFLSLSPFTVQAGDEIANSPIVSTQCTPTNSESAAKLQHTTNGWTFKYGNSGYASLMCSIPLKNSTTGSFTFRSYTVAATDPDTTGTNSQIYTIFYETDYLRSASTYYGYLNTNIRSIYVTADGFPIYRKSPSNGYYSFTLQPNRFYYFFVSMYRSTGSVASPSFRGITFG